jgi:hypothetical protein
MFISMLFNLQAGEASSADVVLMLTIPVGRQFSLVDLGMK